MAEEIDKQSATPQDDAAKAAEKAAAKAEAKAAMLNALPAVESPSISPANPEPEPVAEPAEAAAPAVESVVAPDIAPVLDSPIAPALSDRAPFRLRPRHRLYGALAASVVLAAGLGVLAGVAGSGAFRKAEPARVDTTALADSKALQQSLAKLNKDITTLKANLDAANKAAHTQMAKMSEKLSERLNREAAEITGSIAAPQTTAPQAAAPAPVQAATPLPTPRPQRMAAIEPPPSRFSVVQDWSIRDARDGYVYVQNRGDIYQVVPGAPLPGLGPVEQIKRQDGRWVVVTPKGLIVSARDRSYFE
jgi:hypothetical protein